MSDSKSSSSKDKTQFTRRDLLDMSAAGALVAATSSITTLASAQARKPINISFWTFENPSQRPWVHKRVNLFMQQNPNVKVDFQYFAFGDLGKKLTVGFATGTAPDGFVSQSWLMPTWQAKGLLAPLDVQRLGYSSLKTFTDDFAPAFVAGAVHDGKAYGFPLWFYGFNNYINTRQFKEVGLDVAKDWPKTWEQLGEVAKRLTIKEGNKFVRQGFKFAMHTPAWTMFQFNAILHQCGGEWFDRAGKCTINNAAGLRAMTIRASIARQYGAEDPADSIATAPYPNLDFLKERASMFFNHPIPQSMMEPQNPKMFTEGYYQPVQYPGVQAGKGYSTTYGFNLVVNARAPNDKKEALQDMYKFMMSDLGDAWKDTGPFPPARKTGWADSPLVRQSPFVDEIIIARDQGVALPQTVVYNELADAVHKGIQSVMLNNADIQASLNAIAAEVDRATAAFKPT